MNGSLADRALSEPGLRRRLGLVKRFLERRRADARFRSAADEDPAGAARELGLDEDPAALRRLVLEEPPAAEDSEGVRLFRLLRSETTGGGARAAAPDRPVFRAWRDAQIARCDLQLSRLRNDEILHATLVFELGVGCSVGCWFCGAGAEKLAGSFLRTGENAALWRETLEAARDVCGVAAARDAFCYWATDPLDNPDYERLCEDFVEVVGSFPATTTALALKDVARTRRLLAESERRGVLSNRFSILTLAMLDRLHREFAPEELLFVELVLQNPEAEFAKSLEGRFRLAVERDPSIGERELAKLRSWVTNPDDPAVALPATTACVTGFLVNMLRRTVQLVSPCPASERWPLGYRVFDEARFETAADLERALESMIDVHMSDGAREDRPARLLPELRYEELADGFRVASRTEELEFRSGPLGPYLRSLGAELREGARSPRALAGWGQALFGVPPEDTLDAIDAVWSSGALEAGP